MTIPLSEDEFYRRRDDRTDTVLTDLGEDTYYQNATLLVTADTDIATTYAGQVSILTVGNVLSRFVRNVDFQVPAVPLHEGFRFQQERLSDRLSHEMTAANPFGAFNHEQTRSPAEYDAAIALGITGTPVDPTVHLDVSGWQARITRNTPLQPFDARKANPIGPAVGACLAVAEVFKTISQLSPVHPTDGYTFDAFGLEALPPTEQTRNPAIPKSVRLGDVHMIGVGSVGSALLYFLGMLPVQAHLDLVDFDAIEYVNLNRSPIFTAQQAAAQAAKPTVGEEYLAGHISATGHHMPYQEFVNTVQADTPDVVIPVANEYDVRASIQFNRPPVMVHTTTGGSRVYVRRHIPIVDPCLLCHFPPDDPGFDPTCATAPITNTATTADDAEQADAALPFVSVMAGALLAGELMKLTLPDYPVTKNFVELDMFSTFADSPLAYDRPRPPDCPFCSSQNEAVHRRLIKETEFAHLSDID